jgi:hypothetical protein
MIRTALFGSLTLALVSRPLPGATIYDTGAFTTNGGAMASDFSSSTLTGPIQRADDFVLDGPAEITGVNWWGLYAFSNTPEGQDDFTFRIFADAGGSPASLPLIQFALGNPGRADTGLASFGSEVYAYSALLPSAVTLQGGVMYWLSIVNNTAADRDDNWYWQRVTRFEGSVQQRNTDSSPWVPASDPGILAFNFVGTVVPEPSAGALLLSGAALAVVLARTRRMATQPRKEHVDVGSASSACCAAESASLETPA